MKLSSMRQGLKMTQLRQMHTYPGRGFITPESIVDVIEYLDTNKPVYTCIYFHAAWNPICAKIEKDYDTFVGETSAFQHIKVNCDETPKVKLFFDARYEP